MCEYVNWNALLHRNEPIILVYTNTHSARANIWILKHTIIIYQIHTLQNMKTIVSTKHHFNTKKNVVVKRNKMLHARFERDQIVKILRNMFLNRTRLGFFGLETLVLNRRFQTESCFESEFIK